MAHYAFIDENNLVVQVIVGRDEGELGIDWEEYYSQKSDYVVKRTSFNTVAGQHLEGGTPYRKNYAGIGFSYDEARDAFIPPKTYASWILNEETCLWEAPVDYPQDGLNYRWDESVVNWVEVQGE